MKEIKIPINEMNFTYSRSSGPGGQNVNKVNSKVTLLWNINNTKVCSKNIIERFCFKYSRRIKEDGTVVISSQRFRNQGKNCADCIEKIHAMVNSVAKEPKKRIKTKPTKAAIEKRLKEKKRRSERKRERSVDRS